MSVSVSRDLGWLALSAVGDTAAEQPSTVANVATVPTVASTTRIPRMWAAFLIAELAAAERSNSITNYRRRDGAAAFPTQPLVTFT
jgi:hypothetical protein